MASSKNLFLIFCAVVALALLVTADESKAKGVAVEHYEGGHVGSSEGEAVRPGGSHSRFTGKPGDPSMGGPKSGGSHTGSTGKPGGPYQCGHGGCCKGGPGHGGGPIRCPPWLLK